MVFSHTCCGSSALRKPLKSGLCRSVAAAATSALELASACVLPYTGSAGSVSPDDGGETRTGMVRGATWSDDEPGTPVALGCIDARDAGLLPHAAANNTRPMQARNIANT